MRKRRPNPGPRHEISLMDWLEFTIAWAEPSCEKCGRPLEMVCITSEDEKTPELLYVRCINRKCESEHVISVHFHRLDVPEGR